MSRLTQNFSSRYFDASQYLRKEKYTFVKVFVEGYDDVSFWRGIFDQYENEQLKFEISVPARDDLAKGKKVVMSMIPESGKNLILCVDSDFDYLFGDFNDQSRQVNNTPYLFQTYAYATENYICYPPTLHGMCVKATKNDRKIFDFEEFMREYSRIIYPLFIWYAFSARKSSQKAFSLNDFKKAVQIHFLDLNDNGAKTLEWLQRQVEKRIAILRRRQKNRPWTEEMKEFELAIKERGVTEENVYLFMQGHTLKDNVVVVLLQAVCEKLREISNSIIINSQRKGVSLKNELSNYNNSLRNVKEILEDNEGYKGCFLYLKLVKDIENFVCHWYPDTQSGVCPPSDTTDKAAGFIPETKSISKN